MNYRRKIIQYEEEAQELEDRQMKRIMEIFPYNNPYDQQIESMKVILDTLKKKQNLLFQSPTGTGKSLMVMCAAAAFAEDTNPQYQILFLTRTNGQINGLVKELNKIRNIDEFVSKYSILAGRNNFCIKKDQFRQYMIDNKIDPNGKNLHKKYELFCTDCKKCLIKSSAKKDLDNENILKVSEPLVIGLPNSEQQQLPKKKVQVMSAIETDINNEEEINQEGKSNTQKELACLHYGLNEMLKEKEYKFEGYHKVKFLNNQNKQEQVNNQQFDIKNHLNLLEMIEKQEEEQEEDYDFSRNNSRFEEQKQNSSKQMKQSENDQDAEYDERLPDIEDMVKIFKEKKGQCPFYFNRYISKQSNIVFMNYNYLLNPDILTYVSANIIDRQKKQIIIFDEAHNIEQQAESQFQTKLKLRNLQKAFDLISNVLIILRLAKQLRLLDVVKQKGLELIDKIKDSSKSKAPEKNDKEKLVNQANYEIQLKTEHIEQQLEEEEEFAPQSLNQRSKPNLNEENIDQIQMQIGQPLIQFEQDYSHINQQEANIQNSILKEKDLNILFQNYDDNSIQKSGGKFQEGKQTSQIEYQDIQITNEYNLEIGGQKFEEEKEQNEDIEIKQEKSFIYKSFDQQLQMETNQIITNQEMEIQDERDLIEIIRKENIERDTIKIEDEEMNEIAVDFNEQRQKDEQDQGEGEAEDKYEKQKKLLEDFMNNYENKIPQLQGYLNKLINYCQARQTKWQKAESNLLSEYHFVKTYYALFGLISQNDSDKENQIKEETEGQKTILQEANEVLKQKTDINSEYQKNIDLFNQFSEFSFIFQQTMRYIKVKYSRECQQKAIEDVLSSAVYYEGNLHQLKVSLRYFANNLQPLNHLTKIKKILVFLTKLKDFHYLSMIQQQQKKRQSISYLRTAQTKYNVVSQNQFISEEFNLESPDLQKLMDFYFAVQKNEQKGDIVFTLGCLSGKYAFREIFSKLNVHSLILSSGTLEPFDILTKNLDVKFEIYSGKHVIEAEKQVFTQFIKESNDNGTPLNFSFEKLYMDDIEIREQKRQNIMSTLNVIQNIVKTIQDQNIKGGVLVFFKSYELMYNFYQAFLGSEAQKLLKDIPLFFEKATNAQFQTDFAQFKKYVQVQKKTSLFFAACRGKLAEGIDLSDSLARCVLLVGVPLWNISDPYFICKKKYVELVLKMDSNEWSRKQVIKCVNQAAGRSIRHRFDWGSVFFICELFDQTFHPRNFKKYISKWILLGENKQKDYISAYKQFLLKNSNQ